MRRIAVPVLLAAVGCSDPPGGPADRPLPLVPGGTPPTAPVTSPPPTEPTIPGATVPPPGPGVPAAPPPYLGGASGNAEPYESTEDRCSTRSDQSVPCIDVDTVPPQWTLEPGYEYMGLSPPTDDINGDGLLDAHVDVQQVGANVTESVFVYAPLMRELVLPRDADLHIGNESCWFGDWTADGNPDALCYVPDPADPLAWWEPAIGVVAGPLAGNVQPDLDATLIYAPPPEYITDFVDTDFDGLVEPAVASPGRVDLWRTNDIASWLTGPPTLAIQFPCMRDQDLWEQEDIPAAHVEVCDNDDEGDGVYDLEVSLSSILYTDCAFDDQWYLVPAQTVGFVDLETWPIARKGWCLDSVGDQDGDGVADFEWGDVVYSGLQRANDMGGRLTHECRAVHTA